MRETDRQTDKRTDGPGKLRTAWHQPTTFGKVPACWCSKGKEFDCVAQQGNHVAFGLWEKEQNTEALIDLL